MNSIKTEFLNAVVCLFSYVVLSLTIVTTYIAWNEFGAKEGFIAIIFALFSVSFFISSISLLFSKWVITNEKYKENLSKADYLSLAKGIAICAGIGGILFFVTYQIFVDAITNDSFFNIAKPIITNGFFSISYFFWMTIILYAFFFLMSLITRVYKLPQIFTDYSFNK